MNIIANVLAAIGMVAANIGTQGCTFLFFDEPKAPRSLIEK